MTLASEGGERARIAGGMSGIVLLLLIVPILRHPLFDRFIHPSSVVAIGYRPSSHAGET